jgi:S-DNA-T family DNA segregation ATPase FtsK/SpoIIIE
MQDDYADDIESKDMEDAGAEHPPVVINRYDGADRAKKKDDLFKYQTQIGVDENKTPVIKAPYMAPPVSLLREVVNDSAESVENYEEKIQALESALSDFKVPAKVVSVTPGPTVTRYELQMPPGVPVSRLTSRANDIAMCLASNGEIRIEAPIPGKSLLGIELPNQKRQKVWLKELIDSAEFMNKKSAFTFALGKEISGKNIILDFTKMPHLLVAGSTGSGKSVCLNTLIISLLYKASPDDVRMILIDPKRVEFNVYNGLPHLMIKEVITDAEKAISAFNWAIGEMEKRFLLFRDTVSKDIISYNEKMKESGGQTLPRIFIIVDELAELMMINKRELEEKIKKISQLSRAAGIHLILATQRPSVDIITGVIKANLNSRVTFKLMTQADSRTVIDCSGAEKLLGEGDMIFISNNMPKPIRLQGPFVSMEEVEAIVDFVKQNNEAYFDEEIENDIYNYSDGEEDEETEDSDETDKYFIEALKLAIEAGQISISMVQRRFAVGYSRAGKIIDELERRKFISPFEGSKPRQVLITKEEFERRFGGGEDF